MKNKILQLLLLFIVFQFSNAQERVRYLLEIPNKAYVPEVVSENDGVLELRLRGNIESNQRINTVLSSFTVYEFKELLPGTQNSFLKNKYVLDLDNNDDIGNLTNQYSSYYPSYFIEEDYEPLDIPINPIQYTPNDWENPDLTDNIKISNYDDYEQNDLRMIGARLAWEITKGEPSVIIGVADQGFDIEHEDFETEFVGGVSDYDDQYGPHGNYVAGFASAATDNDLGVSSIGFNTKLIGAKGGSVSNLLLLAQYDPKPKVVNLSFGLDSSYNQNIQDMVNAIDSLDVTVVIAGGNGEGSGSGDPSTYYWPASYKNVIAVSTVGNKNEINSTIIPYDNWKDVHSCYHKDNGVVQSHQHNDSIDIVVPAYYPSPVLWRDADHTDPWKDDYRRTGFGGTSLSAPIVAGTIGLMHSVNYCLKPREVETILKLTAVKVDTIPENLPYYGKLGAGRLDAYQAVKMARDMKSDFGTVTVSDRILYRPWFYKLETAPYVIKMANNTITDSAKIKFRARAAMEIVSGLYQPEGGYIDLQINPNLTSCEVPTTTTPSKVGNIKEDNPNDYKEFYFVTPTLVDSEVIVKSEPFNPNLKTIRVYDFYNQLVYKKSSTKKSETQLNLTNLKPGIYIIKLYNNNNETIYSTKIVKK
ncbi:S8 family peptidase [Marixanthomonas spongiae]|uniref:T9SS C-terminal target domain-containing protein n=1 Tax=Marixanthomonas spongiae TaxID=2174845 RepID=A0A2U0I644_9FLAO|nr:S8 family peptidase [Marixanthomonas spongiae]PVW16534.1 hypothetical protein DDV96_04610 [Marixanthomonas spongiae]